LKIIGHGNPANNLEWLCIMYAELRECFDARLPSHSSQLAQTVNPWDPFVTGKAFESYMYNYHIESGQNCLIDVRGEVALS
jgi:hypothetical protein